MTAPAGTGAGAVRWIGPAEVRRGERGHILREAELVRRGVKGIESLAQFGEQIRLARQLIAVRVVTADRAEEDLALHAQVSAGGDQLRDHIELLAEVRGRENGSERRDARERGREQLVRGDRARDGVRIRLLKKIV